MANLAIQDRNARVHGRGDQRHGFVACVARKSAGLCLSRTHSGWRRFFDCRANRFFRCWKPRRRFAGSRFGFRHHDGLPRISGRSTMHRLCGRTGGTSLGPGSRYRHKRIDRRARAECPPNESNTRMRLPFQRGFRGATEGLDPCRGRDEHRSHPGRARRFLTERRVLENEALARFHSEPLRCD